MPAGVVNLCQRPPMYMHISDFCAGDGEAASAMSNFSDNAARNRLVDIPLRSLTTRLYGRI